jgi:hypothetical protein
MAEGKVELPARPKANKDLTQGLFEMLEFKQFQVVGPAIYNIGGYDE